MLHVGGPLGLQGKPAIVLTAPAARTAIFLERYLKGQAGYSHRPQIDLPSAKPGVLLRHEKGVIYYHLVYIYISGNSKWLFLQGIPLEAVQGSLTGAWGG